MRYGIGAMFAIILLMNMTSVSAVITQNTGDDTDDNKVHPDIYGIVYLVQNFSNPIPIEEINNERKSLIDNYKKEKGTTRPIIYSETRTPEEGVIIAYGFKLADDGTTSEYVGIAGNSRSVPKILERAKMWYNNEIKELEGTENNGVINYGESEVIHHSIQYKRVLTPDEVMAIYGNCTPFLPDNWLQDLENESYTEKTTSTNEDASVRSESSGTILIKDDRIIMDWSVPDPICNWERVQHEFPLLYCNFSVTSVFPVGLIGCS